MRLRPSEIYFSQAEINNHFDRRSIHRNKNIGETLDDLMEGRCSVTSIPTISVCKRDGRWLTADNRRLWVFRHLEKLGGCTDIPVLETNVIDPRKLNSNNGGRTVRFYSRRYASGKWHSRVLSIDPGEPSPFPTVGITTSSNQTFNSFSLSNVFTRASTSLNQRFSSDITDQLETVRLENRIVWSKLNPSNIRYTKGNIPINAFFENLKMTLLYNANHADEIDPVDVYKVFGKHWVTDGHKRLWSFKEAYSINPAIQINADIKEDKDQFLDLVRKERPYLTLIDILQSEESIQITY